MKNFLAAFLFMLASLSLVAGPGQQMLLAVKPAAAPSTTLDSFAGLVEWHKTPVVGGINGVELASWLDSKSSYNLFHTGPATGVYTTGAVNGYAALTFNGTTQFYPEGGSDASTYPISGIAVIKPTDTSGDYCFVGSAGAGGLEVRLESGTGKIQLIKESVALIGISTSGITTGVWQDVMWVVTSTTWAIWINGSSVGSGSHSVSLTADQTFGIGGTNGAGDLYKGGIVEVGLYNQARTADASAMHLSVSTKYAY